jgi:hypothetical protein
MHGGGVVRVEPGRYAPTGAMREVWDWHPLRRLANQEDLFGRACALGGRRVIMPWGDPPGWEAMRVKALKRAGIRPRSETLVIVGDDRQYRAGSFLRQRIGDVAK